MYRTRYRQGTSVLSDISATVVSEYRHPALTVGMSSTIVKMSSASPHVQRAGAAPA